MISRICLPEIRAPPCIKPYTKRADISFWKQKNKAKMAERIIFQGYFRR